MEAIYRFIFKEGIPWKEIRETLYLSIVSAQNIFGKPKVKLDSYYEINEETKTLEIDKTTEVGQHISQHFVSWITRSFGDDAFRVERLRKRKKFSRNATPIKKGRKSA